MMMNNENKKVSRNRKRRVERRNKVNEDIKLLLNKITSEREKKNKNLVKLKK